MVRSTYGTTNVMGAAIVVQTYDDDSTVYVEMYDGETVRENLLAEMSLSADSARALAMRLLRAADKADTV